jgi:uncharacterized membrane protein (DUF485 family)
MRRRTFARDLAGTVAMFIVLVLFVIIIMFGENFLDNFKSH